MNEKHYVKPDGNGGFNVSKSVAILTLVVLILSVIGSVVAVTTYGVTNRNGIEHNKETISDIKESQHYIEADISELQIDYSSMQTDINYIKEQVSDIHNHLLKE